MPPVSYLGLAVGCTVLRSRGVRVVSISPSYSPDTVVHRRPGRFNLWKKLRSPRSLWRTPGGHLVHVDLLAPYVFLDRPGVLYYPSRVALPPLWVGFQRIPPNFGIRPRPAWINLGRSPIWSARSKEPNVET